MRRFIWVTTTHAHLTTLVSARVDNPGAYDHNEIVSLQQLEDGEYYYWSGDGQALYHAAKAAIIGMP